MLEVVCDRRDAVSHTLNRLLGDEPRNAFHTTQLQDSTRHSFDNRESNTWETNEAWRPGL